MIKDWIMSLKNIPWLEILAPFWKDIQIVSGETSALRLIRNNEELMEDDQKYAEILRQVEHPSETKKWSGVSVEIGFFSSLIIFLFIILPGICFRRGYYHGAFTRQFRFSGQGLLTVAYTFVLGLALNFVFIELFNCLQDYDIVVNTELDNFKKLLEDDNQNTSRTSGNSFEGFYESCRNTYWSYLAGIYIFSMLSGFVLNRLVILLGLDLSVRILQFNNEWQYIFDGRKLDQNKQVISRKKFSRRIKYVFVDILTDNGSERGQLYRGLLKNYEINDKDPSKLSSISISKVKRWKRVFDQNKSESWEPVEIPGDLFTILGDRILNVNCH